MDPHSLQQQHLEKRRFLINQGFLNHQFMMLESFEEHQVDFMEDIIEKYCGSTPQYLDQLEKVLDAKPVVLYEVERLIMKLKGASASFGAAKILRATNEMWEAFKKRDFDRLNAALEKVKSEFVSLKFHLGEYAEILAKLRGDAVPPDASSDNNEEMESTDSNDMKD